MKLPSLTAHEEGAVAMLWAVLLPAMLGFTGLGVEVSSWHMQKSDLQKAVDAAAVAAGYTVGTGNSATTVATAEMARNGQTIGGSVTIAVNSPPASGSYSANGNAVEVIVTKPVSAMFAKKFLSNGVTLQSRAVSLATLAPTNTGSACVLALRQNPSDAINVNGNANVNMQNCDAVANSNNNQAITAGGQAQLTVNRVYTRGNWSTNGQARINNTAPNVSGGQVVPDPFANVPAPSVSTCNYNNTNVNGGTVTLNPGVYCNGLTINAGANVTLNPGTYVINNSSFNINGNATVSGNGVTFALTSASGSTPGFNLNGGATLTLTAPSTGTYAGILFYQDRRSTAASNFNGGSTARLTGALYFPGGDLTFNGGVGAQATCTRIIAGTVRFNGGANFSNSCPSGYPDIATPGTGGGAVTSVALME